MKIDYASTLEGYRRHAETYGPELVFETAVLDGLDVVELGKLSLALQRIKPSWRVKSALKTNTGAFAAMLMARGESAKRAAEMAQVSIKTARDHYHEGSWLDCDLETTL